MPSGQYISVRETAQILSISEKKVIDLIEGRKLQAYRIADQFLRLKRDEVLAIKEDGTVDSETIEYAYTTPERIHDFFYFNDFYLLSILCILTLLYVIFNF